MEKINVSQARKVESVGRQVLLQGWVRTRRDSKAGFSFLEINDGTCFGNVQVIAEAKLPNYQSEILHLSAGASVSVEGGVQASPAKGQPTEIAHLRPRSNTFGAVMRVRHQVSRSIHEFFWENGFYYVHAPIITASDAEGAGQMFR